MLKGLWLKFGVYRQVAEFVEVRGGKDLTLEILGIVMDLLDHFLAH